MSCFTKYFFPKQCSKVDNKLSKIIDEEIYKNLLTKENNDKNILDKNCYTLNGRYCHKLHDYSSIILEKNAIMNHEIIKPFSHTSSKYVTKLGVLFVKSSKTFYSTVKIDKQKKLYYRAKLDDYIEYLQDNLGIPFTISFEPNPYSTSEIQLYYFYIHRIYEPKNLLEVQQLHQNESSK